jgi:hypothetical protein
VSVARTYEHFVYASDPHALAAIYQTAGFIVEPCVDCSEGHVSVYTAYDDEMRAEVERIAQGRGSEYDGGGMYVGPIDLLDPQ